jgi:hypothetical protein
MNETPDTPATEAVDVNASLGGAPPRFIDRAGPRVDTGITAGCPR